MDNNLDEKSEELAQKILAAYQSLPSERSNTFLATVSNKFSHGLANLAYGGLAGHAFPYKQDLVQRKLPIKTIENARDIVKTLQNVANSNAFGDRAVFMGMGTILEELGIKNPYHQPSLSLAEEIKELFKLNLDSFPPPTTSGINYNDGNIRTLQNTLMEDFERTGRVTGWPDIINPALKTSKTENKYPNYKYDIEPYERLLNFSNQHTDRQYQNIDSDTAAAIEGTSWETHWREELAKRGKNYPQKLQK